MISIFDVIAKIKVTTVKIILTNKFIEEITMFSVLSIQLPRRGHCCIHFPQQHDKGGIACVNKTLHITHSLAVQHSLAC